MLLYHWPSPSILPATCTTEDQPTRRREPLALSKATSTLTRPTPSIYPVTHRVALAAYSLSILLVHSPTKWSRLGLVSKLMRRLLLDLPRQVTRAATGCQQQRYSTGRMKNRQIMAVRSTLYYTEKQQIDPLATKRSEAVSPGVFAVFGNRISVG